jgi:hypothetical protein
MTAESAITEVERLETALAWKALSIASMHQDCRLMMLEMEQLTKERDNWKKYAKLMRRRMNDQNRIIGQLRKYRTCRVRS